MSDANDNPTNETAKSPEEATSHMSGTKAEPVCPSCFGHGLVPVLDRDNGYSMHGYRPCPECGAIADIPQGEQTEEPKEYATKQLMDRYKADMGWKKKIGCKEIRIGFDELMGIINRADLLAEIVATYERELSKVRVDGAYRFCVPGLPDDEGARVQTVGPKDQAGPTKSGPPEERIRQQRDGDHG
jgi:hypothetical protein